MDDEIDPFSFWFLEVWLIGIQLIGVRVGRTYDDV